MIKILLILLIAINLKSEWYLYEYSDNIPSNGKDLIFDKNNNLWTKTTDNQLLKFDGFIWEIINSSNSNLPYDSVSIIRIGDEKEVYFVNYNKQSSAIVKYDGIDYNHFNKENETKYSSNTITDFFINNENNFWVATDSELYHYNNNITETYPEIIDNIVSDKLNNLYLQSKNDIFKVEFENEISFSKFNYPYSNFGNFTNLMIDSLNNIWVETSKIYPRCNQGKTWYIFDNSVFDNLNWIFPKVSLNKKVYTQTSKAIFELNEKNDFIKFTVIPDSIYSIYGGNLKLEDIDLEGNFWFSTKDKGILKYTSNTVSVSLFKNNSTIYPNPSQSKITVNSDQQITELALYTSNLRKVSDYIAMHTTSQAIDISNLSSGVYFIKVNNDFVKFVKE